MCEGTCELREEMRYRNLMLVRVDVAGCFGCAELVYVWS